MSDFERSALRYDVAIDHEVETTHSRLVRMIGQNHRVLDLGCATGILAKALKEHDCTVVGVEVDPDAASVAEAHCERVIVADLQQDLSTLDLGGPFDVIVAADVLEHLVDPAATLRGLSGLLAPGGYLVTSIPNIAHGSVRLALLTGRFPYRDTGLLDHTHLRFFTATSMQAMLADGGFAVAHIERTELNADDGEVLDGVPLEGVPVDVLAFLAGDPEARAYQFVSISFPAPLASGVPGLVRRLSVALEEATEGVASREQQLAQALTDVHLANLETLRQRDLNIRHEARMQRQDGEIAALHGEIARLAAIEAAKFTPSLATRATAPLALRDPDVRQRAKERLVRDHPGLSKAFVALRTRLAAR